MQLEQHAISRNSDERAPRLVCRCHPAQARAIQERASLANRATTGKRMGVLRLRRGSAFASVACTGLATQAITAVSGPLVARMLGPDGRGEMVLVLVVAFMVSQIGVGGLPMAIAHTVAVARQPARNVVRSQILRWGMGGLILGIVAGTATAVLLLNSRHGWGGYAAMSFMLTIALIWQFLLSGMVQGEGSVAKINIYRLVGLTMYAASILGLFVFARVDNPMIVVATYTACLLGGSIVGVLLLQRPSRDEPAVDLSGLKDFARRSYFSGIGLMDGLGLELLLVGVLLGNAELGYYNVALSATNVSQIVLLGVSQVLLPRLAAAANAAEAAATARTWLLGSIALSALVVLILEVVIAPVIRFAFGTEFVPAIGSARILIVAWALLGLRRVLTSVTQTQGRTSYASRIEVAGITVMLLGIAVVCRRTGIEGAALVVTGAALASCVLLAMAIDWRLAANDGRPDSAEAIVAAPPSPVPSTAAISATESGGLPRRSARREADDLLARGEGDR